VSEGVTCRVLAYLRKTPSCGLTFTTGLLIGGMVATAIGLPAPATPAAADQGTTLLYYLIGSLALALAFLGQGIRGRFLTRWLVLGFFTWVAHFVMFVETSIFVTTAGAWTTGSLLFMVVAKISSALAINGQTIFSTFLDRAPARSRSDPAPQRPARGGGRGCTGR